MIFYQLKVTLPSFELDSSCGYDSLADVLTSSSFSPSNVHASEDVVLGTDLARGGFCLFPSATNSFCGGFIFFLLFIFCRLNIPFVAITQIYGSTILEYFWLCSILT